MPLYADYSLTLAEGFASGLHCMRMMWPFSSPQWSRIWSPSMSFRAFFEKASRLAANYAKSHVYPIRCSEDHVSLVRATLHCQVADFPCVYLGVPLSTHRLPKAALQPLDKVTSRVPAWKQGRLLNRSGRLNLAKSTLAVISVHISMAVAVTPWAIKTMETLIRAFLWNGSETVSSGKCAWINVCCPTSLGGLGLPNLCLTCFTLRLRWLWLAHVDARAWQGLRLPVDWHTMDFFDASVFIRLGNGEITLFRMDN